MLSTRLTYLARAIVLSAMSQGICSCPPYYLSESGNMKLFELGIRLILSLDYICFKIQGSLNEK
jgi:hypothetical protein